MEPELEVGTREWWLARPFGARGPVDTILRLLEQDEISRAKAREALCELLYPDKNMFPDLPFDKLNWG